MRNLLVTWFLLAVAFGVSAQCLAPAGEVSGMAANPVDQIDGIFRFDHKIKSDVKFSMDGNVEHLTMDYYVNSADGSILFPSGPMGFFNTNLGVYRNADGRIDGAIWLANGQMVTYVYDADNSIKRAITRQSAQTAEGRFGNDYMHMMQFFTSSAELAAHPVPMPSHIRWNSVTRGYKGQLVEARTGLTNTWTLYFDTTPTSVKTSAVMVGFMVGVLKDAREGCNRLVVYNKVDIGGEGTGNYIEAALSNMLPSGITFDASEYKPMTLGGDAGTDIQGKMAGYQARMADLLRRKETLKERRSRCLSDFCRDQVDREVEELREREKRLKCEMARAMGMEDVMEDCN